MSDPTQAQAEDRRAQIQARLEGEWRGMEAQVATCEHALHRSPIGCPYCQRDERLMDLLLAARAELSRLSRVEQALRTECTCRLIEKCERCEAIDAALSASPEAQPEERARSRDERSERWP